MVGLCSLEKIRRKKARTIVGLISGTSAHGVSALLAKIGWYGLETRLAEV